MSGWIESVGRRNRCVSTLTGVERGSVLRTKVWQPRSGSGWNRFAGDPPGVKQREETAARIFSLTFILACVNLRLNSLISLAKPMSLIFSRQCEYALQAVLYLALKPSGEMTSIKELTRALGIPYHFLGKILQDLTRKGLLASHKGPTGGFALDMPAKDITLFHVVDAVDGQTSHAPACLAFRNVRQKPLRGPRTVGSTEGRNLSDAREKEHRRYGQGNAETRVPPGHACQSVKIF